MCAGEIFYFIWKIMCFYIYYRFSILADIKLFSNVPYTAITIEITNSQGFVKVCNFAIVETIIIS